MRFLTTSLAGWYAIQLLQRMGCKIIGHVKKAANRDDIDKRLMQCWCMFYNSAHLLLKYSNLFKSKHMHIMLILNFHKIQLCYV